MTPAVMIHLTWGAARSLALGAWRAGRGRTLFLDSFVPEGLAPLDAEARRVARMSGGCLGCGACEDADGSPRSVLEAARSLHRLEDVEADIRALCGLPAGRIARLERTCPASIPFGSISEALSRMLDRGSQLG
jgi:hypothetical protein